MDLGGLFLNRGNMSFKHGRSVKYPDVSKPQLWNSGGGPYTSGALHVSLTAVVEAHQTWRRHQPLAALRNHDDAQTNRDDRMQLSTVSEPSPGKNDAETLHCLSFFLCLYVT